MSNNRVRIEKIPVSLDKLHNEVIAYGKKKGIYDYNRASAAYCRHLWLASLKDSLDHLVYIVKVRILKDTKFTAKYYEKLGLERQGKGCK